MENKVLSEVDVPAMALLLKEGFPASIWGGEDLKRFIILKSCKAWGSFQGAHLIGFSLIQKAADEAEILMIVVHPNFRKRGVAHSLLETSLGYLEKEGITRLFLEVSVENKRAINFYTKIGFEMVGNRKNYYPNKQNQSAHIMLRKIK